MLSILLRSKTCVSCERDRMYQEVFVFVAVNPEEAFGLRDIDFSLYPVSCFALSADNVGTIDNI